MGLSSRDCVMDGVRLAVGGGRLALAVGSGTLRTGLFLLTVPEDVRAGVGPPGALPPAGNEFGRVFTELGLVGSAAGCQMGSTQDA